jgi:acyl-CoA synthetase (AMP-forming)/AMP-acid ligase II
MLSMNSIEWLEFLAACHLSGYIAATVNFRFASAEIAYILKDSSPKILIFEEQYTQSVAAIKAELSGIEHFICIGQAPSWATSYEAVVDSQCVDREPGDYAPDDYAHLIYTSGTTGKPKGALRTQACDYILAQLVAGEFGASADDRILLVMPFFHIGAIAVMTALFLVGGCVVLRRRFQPAEALQALAEHRITICLFAPTMLQALLEIPDIRSYDLSNLRLLCYSAAPMPPALLRRGMELLGSIFIAMYGGTEMGPATTLRKNYHVLGGSAYEQRRLTSVGQPFRGVQLCVMDEHGTACGPNQIGEIAVRGPTVMSAYWNNHAATIEAMRDGWYRTGDVGLLDELGFVYLIDRKKDVIISGGENVYCREVEDTIMEAEGIADAAVIGIPDAKWGEAVKAVVIRAPAARIDEQELIAHCRARIAHYKVPRSITFVAELPRLASGKVSKVALRNRYSAAPAADLTASKSGIDAAFQAERRSE